MNQLAVHALVVELCHETRVLAGVSVAVRDVTLFPVCSYYSLFLINWVIKQSKNLFISILLESYLFYVLNYCF